MMAQCVQPSPVRRSPSPSTKCTQPPIDAVDVVDGHAHAHAHAHAAVATATPVAQLFGSFHYIVQEQAKSMVAIQELQQEVSSLLLFRQAILTALPHLQPKEFMSSSSSSGSSGSNQSTGRDVRADVSDAVKATTWTRRRHSQQLHQQHSLHDSSEHHTATTTTTTTNGVADSGFSTEANSNTSPRSSRFETTSSSTTTTATTSATALDLEADFHAKNHRQHPQHHRQHPPMEKELVQHLERVQHRMARLKKDEDRLLALLQPQPISAVAPPTVKMERQGDELWQLLEEIHTRGEVMKDEMATLQMTLATPAAPPPPPRATAPSKKQTADPLLDQEQDNVRNWAEGGKKRVSFEECVAVSAAQNTTTTTTTTTTTSDTTSDTTTATTAEGGELLKYSRPSRDKVAAILRLTNPVQLQRHLLTALLDNQALREQVERSRADVTSRDHQWRNSSNQSAEQMTALREDNEDLRFQLEEQKIELEGTKARLRMTASRTPAPPPPLQSRSSSSQTSSFSYCSTSSKTMTSSTQTDWSPQGDARLLPRVVDASPKAKLTKISGLRDDLKKVEPMKECSSWEEHDRSLRTSLSSQTTNNSISATSTTPTTTLTGSRIPTPIKASPSPVKLSWAPSPSAPLRRELPDTPGSIHHHISTKMSVSKRPEKELLSPATVASAPAAKSANQRALHKSRDWSDSKVRNQRRSTAAAAAAAGTRLTLSDDANDAVKASLLKTDDYYDSINANHRTAQGLDTKFSGLILFHLIKFFFIFI